MVKPKVLVFSGYGLNCEEETKFAFDSAGAITEIIHINDLVSGQRTLKNFQIVAFPGGFSYGDDTGSGNAFANKVKNQLWEDIEKFVAKDRLAIGICNGFQILVNLGLLPALDKKYGSRQVALLHNTKARYLDRWVDVKVVNDSPWLMELDELPLPIAHGEGRFYADEATLTAMKDHGLIALKYVKGGICQYQNLEANPNGSIENIAGVSDTSKRIFGLMPHPERGMLFNQLPDWPVQKEQLKRAGRPIPRSAQGKKIFENGVRYFTA